MRRSARFGRRIPSLARRTPTMSLPLDTDTTNRQPMDCSVEDESDTAVAAAAALHGDTAEQTAASSSSGGPHAWAWCPAMSGRKVALTNAPVCVACLSVAGSRMVVDGPKMDASGTNQLCELCGRQLHKVKHHRPCGVGQACHPRCKGKKHPLEAVSVKRPASTERPNKKQRRTHSDPGPPLAITSTRLRIRAPQPPPPALRPRPVKPHTPPLDIMALLDATHARRMALLEAEKNGTSSQATNASSLVW